MLLGLLSPLFGILESVIKAAIEWVLQPIMEWIVAPVINFAISVINYILSLYFYTISIFILGLIDFVEMLFRSLAGLGSADGKPSIGLSIDGGEGDILLQLIRHPSIQQAFLSMCIVGLFLLVVTTVFQIIKVEYTTEGAKNAKGPIFQKAFKALANLMLLPLLCVFGIVFSNQLLGLLDKATRADGENPTISGTLFVTAASDAHYKESDAQFLLVSAMPGHAEPQILLNSLGILYQSIKDTVGGYVGGWDEPYRYDIEKVEEGFINQKSGHKYYIISEVSEYYNYGRINYLLLILGGCIVVKCLYFTCFGMVIRLYKCAVLFIISPVVIGMTPINEGGLGKWRGQFIGQVLSAYGTVMSINLFFIIVRVMLAIEVKFYNMGTFTYWGENFMTALLKAIFVMAGCLLIEKFAKEIGGYFGADDAMAAGKDMSKQVGDMAMKGVQVAAAVAGAAATGGASLAGSIGGLVSAGKQGGAKGVVSHIGGAIADKTGITAVRDGKAYRKNLKENRAITDHKANLKKLEDDAGYQKANKDYQEAQKAFKMAVGTGDQAKIDEAQQKFTKAEQARKEAGVKVLGGGNKGAAAFAKVDDYKYNQEIAKLEETHASESYKKTQARAERYAERKQKAKTNFGIATAWAGGLIADSQQQVKGWVPGMGFLQKLDKSAHSGAKMTGDVGEQAMAKLDKMRSDKIEHRFDQDSGGIFAYGAKQLMSGGSNVATDEMGQELSAHLKNLKVNAIQTIKEIEDKIKSLQHLDEKERQVETVRYINQGVEKMNSMGADIGHEEFSGLLNKLEKQGQNFDINVNEDLNVKLDKEIFKNILEEAMKKKGGATMDNIRTAIQEEMQKLGSQGREKDLKVIEEIIKKVMNDAK